MFVQPKKIHNFLVLGV